MDQSLAPEGESLKTILGRYVARGLVYDLGQPFQRGMPLSPLNPPFFFTLSNRHGDRVTAQGVSVANDFISTGSHVGTHIDALGHVSRDGKVYGAIDVSDAQKGGAGLQAGGIEAVPPIIRRGVLLDIALLKKLDCLPPSFAIGAGDLERASGAQGTSIEPGDAVLVRTGWARNWTDAAIYPGQAAGAPGVDDGGALWLAEKRPSVVGADTMGFEVRPTPNFPSVHGILLADHGIHIMENLFLEELSRDGCFTFVLIVLPLKIVGGTASPVRPIALA